MDKVKLKLSYADVNYVEVDIDEARRAVEEYDNSRTSNRFYYWYDNDYVEVVGRIGEHNRVRIVKNSAEAVTTEHPIKYMKQLGVALGNACAWAEGNDGSRP